MGYLVSLMVCLAVSSQEESPGGGKTPEEVFEKLRDSLVKKDWDGFFRCLSSKELKRLEEMWSSQRKKLEERGDQEVERVAKMLGVSVETFRKMSYRDGFSRSLDLSLPEKRRKEIQEMKILEKKVDGERGTLQIQVGKEVVSFDLRQEKGAWYFDDFLTRSMSKAQESAQMATTKVILRQVEQALEIFHVDHGRYPAELADLRVRPEYVKENRWPSGGYLERDPKDAWGNGLVYRIPGTEDRPFDLGSLGADGKEGGTGSNADIWDH